jgi:putative hydrolase of the HAD superfamily
MTVVLFDFFGTLVRYSPNWLSREYPGAAAVLREAGCGLTDDQWRARWDAASGALERRAQATGVEHSMEEIFAAFAPEAGLDPDDADLADRFVRRFSAEWSTGVHAIEGVPELLGRLRDEGHRIGLVSNTHRAATVHEHLTGKGLADAMEVVVTSIEVGVRKPFAEIFTVALAKMGAEPTDAVYVGDNPIADFEGATAVGMDAWLVIEEGPFPETVPADRRLRSILELPVSL